MEILTPWGPESSLRERMLRRGPGIPREDVARNQRERLFGAMVASVARRGYEATRVTDLVEISGVSSRTFYDLFADKRACFFAAMEATVDAAIAFTSAIAAEPGDWERRARRGFKAFGAMIVAQPAAARMFLVDAYAAGPDSIAVMERAGASFESLAREMLDQSPERAAMPAEMISAHIGAMQEMARARLYRREEATLPDLLSELWDLMLVFRPPPAPLRLAVRPPAPPMEALGGHDHGERVRRALAAVVAERGYGNATVDQIVKRASMSTKTFYANYDGKEDALFDTLESGGAQMVAAVLPAFRRAPDWAHGIRAGFGALFGYLGSRPAFARLIAVEIYAAGPAAVERRAEIVRPLEELLLEGRERAPEIPPIAIEAIVGGVYTLVYRRIHEAGPERLPGLAPTCTYIALAPFIGAEQACAVANGDGRHPPAGERGALRSSLA